MKIDLQELLNTSIGGFALIKIVSAVLILVVGALLIKLILKIIKRVLSKTTLVDKSRDIILKIIKIILYVLIILIAISTLGVDTTSLVALASVFSLGITLALENLLSNVAGGLVILSTHPFKVGDYISCNGINGTVDDIRLNQIVIKSDNGERVTIPNKDVSSSQITNYSENMTRRIVLTVTASYNDKTEDVFKALYEAMDTTGVLKDPNPKVYLTNYLESSIEYSLYFWVNWNEYLKVKYLVNERIRDYFDKYGIEMTYNHINVHMIND